MKKIFSIFVILCVSVLTLMITGCEKEKDLPIDKVVTPLSTDDRITELIEDATADKKIQQEMKEELKFLADNEIFHIGSTKIGYDQRLNDFEYIYDGDISMSRFKVREEMSLYIESLLDGDSLSTRSHRRTTGSLVTPGTYTIYSHTGLSAGWTTAVANAISAWNSLGLTVQFVGASTSNTYNAGAITVYMENIPGAYAQGENPSGGLPGYRIRISPGNEGLSASQKKFILTHEGGHNLGFKHTDTVDGWALLSSSYPCILAMCDGTDAGSVMRAGGGTPPSWVGFSYCDQNVFQCIY